MTIIGSNGPVKLSFDSNDKLTEQHIKLIEMESQKPSKVGNIFKTMNFKPKNINFSIDSIEQMETYYKDYYENINRLEKTLKAINEVKPEIIEKNGNRITTYKYPIEDFLIVLEMHKRLGVDLTKLTPEQIEKFEQIIQTEDTSQAQNIFK